MIHEWSILAILIAIVVIAAGVAIVYVALRKFGVTIPDWVVQIFWILVVAVVAILALKFLWSMW